MRCCCRSSDRKDVPWKSFSDVTKGARVQSGIFTLYQKRDNSLSLACAGPARPGLPLGHPASQGIGELGLDGGSSVRSDLVRFHRAGDRIELWVVNPHFAATPGTPMARAVAYSFGHSVAQSFPIATMRDNGEILVDLAPFLLSDWADLGLLLPGRRRLSGSSQEPSSWIAIVRAWSSSSSSPVTWKPRSGSPIRSNRNLGLDAIADYRWIPVGVHYSLLELPATPMRPRYADERVGYFVSAIKDFSRDTAESFFVRFVNRWRLEKRDPGAASASRSSRSSTTSIAPSRPSGGHGSGPASWNGIAPLRRPASAMPSRCSMRRTTPSGARRTRATPRCAGPPPTAVVYAVGPSNVDPRTGEILNADVLVSAAWIQTWRGESGEYVRPRGAVRSVVR